MFTLNGSFGADELIGQGGDDQLSGAALSNLIFGGDEFDFINGGIGHDRLNGSDGGDRFFHLGIFDHGSDWIQDYDQTEGDLLVWGRVSVLLCMSNLVHASPTKGHEDNEDYQGSFRRAAKRRRERERFVGRSGPDEGTEGAADGANAWRRTYRASGL